MSKNPVLCKVTNEPIKDCKHCHEKCSFTGHLVMMCAHCNVNRFVSSTTGSVKSPKVQSKIERPKLGVVFTEVDSPESFLAQFPQVNRVEQDHSKFQCSFCKGFFSLNLVNKTEGITEIKKVDRSTIVKDSSGNVHFDKVTGHLATKVVACPDCCHLVKPLYKKDGELKHKGTILPPIND